MDPINDDTNSSIVLSYHTSPSPDVWERIQADLHRQLPLKNLNWKPSNRPSRLIPSLPISFQPIDSIARSLSSEPLVHLLFVACDDHEAYKTIIKQEIRTWLDSVQSDQSEWLIVHVSTAPKLNNATAGIFRTKTGVLDKLKSDFNPQKQDRCIQLSIMNTMDTIVHASVQDTFNQWSEFIGRLKESLLIVLERKIIEMEESLKTLLSKRTRHGWDFETLFIQKAQLANQFEIINLLEESLIQYDELEAAFFQSLLDFPHVWQSKVFGKNSDQFSKVALNADNSEQYLELVGSGQMSIFDLRVYLFSKQVNLLGRLGRPDEAIQRAATFVPTFSALLRSYERIWPPNYLESWIYCTSNALVEWCEQKINPNNRHPANMDCLRCCAQLLELAHNQLDRIGVQTGHLPLAHPFNMSLSHVEKSPIQPKSSSSTFVTPPSNLPSSLQDLTKFEKIYLDLSRRTINLYQSTGRRRSALKMHCKIAEFEQVRKRQESAHRLYSHLPAHYVDDKWTKIESSLLDRCAGLQKELGLSKEWLLSTLALVRSGVTYELGKWNQDVLLKPSIQQNEAELADQSELLASKLIQDIKEQSMKLEKDFAAVGFPTFSITLNTPIGHISEHAEGSIVQANIKNLLPCIIEIEAVRMKFSGKKYETLWFTAGNSKLLPGETKIDLFCTTLVDETLILEVSQIRISRILFQYYHRPQSPPNSSLIDQKPLETVSFPKDPLSLDVKLDSITDISVEQTRQCVLNLFSGRKHLSQASVSLDSSTSINFDLARANVCKSCEKYRYDESDDKFTLEDIEPNSDVCLSVPFYTSTDQSSIDVNIRVDYRLSEDETVKRTFRKMSTLMIALPIHVKLRQLLRSECAFTSFTVRTVNPSPLRIAGAQLDVECLPSDSEISITPTCSSDQASFVIFPSQTTDYTFKITTTSAISALAESRLKLVIKYRALIDEMVECLSEKLTIASPQEHKKKIPYIIEQVKNVLIGEPYDEELCSTYLYDRKLPSEQLSQLNWNFICNQVEKDPVKINELTDMISLAIQDSSLAFRESQLPWRSITFWFDLFTTSILATISYHRQDELTSCMVGNSMTVNISISISYKWFPQSVPNHKDLVSNPPTLIYDLVSNRSNDWLVGGRKRGQFIARENEAEEIKVVLIPLRPGHLNFPKINLKLAKKPLSKASPTDAIGQLDLGDPSVKKGQETIKIECCHSNLFEPILVLPSSDSCKYLISSSNLVSH